MVVLWSEELGGVLCAGSDEPENAEVGGVVAPVSNVVSAGVPEEHANSPKSMAKPSSRQSDERRCFMKFSSS